jgi:hypothetical protein
LPPIVLFAVIAALAYAWIVHLPLAYLRMSTSSLALSPLVVIELARRLPRRLAAAGGGAVALAVAAFAWPQATNVRDFYSFATPATLRGLDAVPERVRPGEVIVTDRCWSFLARGWFMRRRSRRSNRPTSSRRPSSRAPVSSRGPRRICTRETACPAAGDPLRARRPNVRGSQRPPGARAGDRGAAVHSDRLAVVRLPGKDDRPARGG